MCASQIQALGAGIDFKVHIAPGCLRGDALKIEGISIAMHQDAAGGVTQDADVGGFQSAQHAIGHLGGFQIHVAVDAGDHNIEFSQGVFGEIHFPVAADVALQTRQDVDTEPVLIQLAHSLGERDGACFIQAVGHGESFRVVRDGDVFVAQGAGGFGHFLQRGAAVGFGGVHMQVAADVGKLHQFREASFESRLNLAAVFAQLRRNPCEAQLGVHFLLGFARHALLIVHTEQPVFIERQAELLSAQAQDDVVFLAASEILHRRAVAFMR